MRPFPALSLALLALACSGDPTAPRTPDLHPSFDVAPNVPNVFRVRGEFATGILDTETDLIAIAGLPANPKDLVDCGGAELLQIANWQFVGDKLQAAIKALVKLDPANLVVYRLSTFVDLCVSTPLAQGTGRVMYTDSDIFYTGGGEDSWGFRMEGTVTLASGGTAHLLAHNRWQIQTDGTVRRIFRQVKLLGQ
jgi:hypothetical protein